MSSSVDGQIIAATVSAGGVHILAKVKRGNLAHENVRVIFGTFLLVAVLLLMANFWPDPARGLALVVLVTSLAMNGGDAMGLLAGIVK